MEAAMKIKNRQQFLVVLTVAAFALLVGVNFILEPLGGWWSSRQAQIKVLQGKVDEGQKLIRREAGIRSRWDSMRTNALPANTSLAEQNLLQSVSEWARSSGAELTSVMPQWKSDSTNYLTLACRVESAGDLGTLSKFLYDLEKGPLALRLDAVELSARDASGQQMTMGLEINGLALVARDKK
jgi:Tfp pilus assembly protein PilO